MARKKSPEGSALNADEGVSVPRLKLSETGFSALKTRSGRILEEANQQFQMPNLARVVAEMSYSPAIAIGLGATNTLIARAPVVVEPVVGENEVDKARREFLFSTLHDMENSFQSTMQCISTSKEWGHQVSEMVFRRRLWVNGSRFNDGLVGLAKLAHRPQATIAKWNFDPTGRDLVSISQSIANVEDSWKFQNLTDENGYIVIPREKFLLFRSDNTSDNPLGTSCLKSCYLAFKQLTLLEDHMLRGVSKDVSGIPFAQIPVKYMASDASAEDKAVYDSTKQILDNISDGLAKSVVFPKLVDPDTKADLFELTIMEQKSNKSYDLPLIIRQLQSNILSVLSADSIVMGSEGGSFSLQDSSTNLLALRVSFLLSQIADTMNQHLVPTLWKLNGWSTEHLPKIKFGDLSSASLEEFSKAIQRLASTNCLELNRANLNKIYEVMGFEKRPDDEPVNPDDFPSVLAGMTSKSGAGMNSPVGEGTRKDPFGNQNASDNNNDNQG